MGVRAEAAAGAHLSPGGAACAAPRRPMAVSMRTLGVIGEELALAAGTCCEVPRCCMNAVEFSPEGGPNCPLT